MTDKLFVKLFNRPCSNLDRRIMIYRREKTHIENVIWNIKRDTKCEITHFFIILRYII
jgi:hypothetical protein